MRFHSVLAVVGKRVSPRTFDLIRQIAPSACVSLLAVGMSVYFLTGSDAAALATSQEAENGAITGNARVVNDSGASAVQAAKFDSESTSGNCTSPVYTSSDALASWTAPNGYLVNNNAWNGSAGPQTLYVCNYNSWYVMSNQPNDSGAVETGPDTQINFVSAPSACTMPDCGPDISSMHSLTSTFGISVPSSTDIGYDANYDTWVDGLSTGNCEEVMVWNKYENDLNGSTLTYTDQSIGGTTWNILWQSSPGGGNCGYVAFIMANQESTGTVNLLAIYDWIIGNHPAWFGCSSAVACEAGGSNPAELSTVEYGIEIAYTDGTQQFALTSFSVSSN